jgi:uncharacterized protein
MTSQQSPHARLQRIDPQAVRWTGGFWAEKFALCKDVTIASMRQALDDPQNTATWDNLYIAAGLREGEYRGLPASDGDCFKWLEAVAHAYGISRDPELDRLLDELIDVVAKAQAADGYISTAIQLTGKARWAYSSYEELYNMGHLITAGCVHYQATGKNSLLNVAIKAADLLYRVFSPRPPELIHLGFTPSQMMALVDLYRVTGDRRYLELADIFVTNRGQAPRIAGEAVEPGVADGSDELQDRVPLRQETEAVGHVVAATFLYCAAADVYAETGEQALVDALERLWQDVACRKLYVTGGVGAHHGSDSRRNDRIDEAFGLHYQLPNATGYNETCANIGYAMWNWRMLNIAGDARYADVLEQVLYNSMLSGLSIDGAHFLYTNPLRWYGSEHELLGHNDRRTRWTTHTCYCCPPNLARTLAGLHNWLYSLSDEGVWVHLYAGSRLDTRLGCSAVALRQETGYPWDGAIKLTIERAPAAEMSLMLRIPGWADQWSIAINGGTAAVAAHPGSYAVLKRRWSPGDAVELSLPMPVRLLEAHPKVEEARNQVAIQRGPIVYCMEGIDLAQGVSLADVRIPRAVRLTPRYDAALLGGVTVLEGDACHVAMADWRSSLYRTLPTEPSATVPIRLIPYYAWNNRGVTPMSVWLPLC